MKSEQIQIQFFVLVVRRKRLKKQAALSKNPLSMLDTQAGGDVKPALSLKLLHWSFQWGSLAAVHSTAQVQDLLSLTLNLLLTVVG